MSRIGVSVLALPIDQAQTLKAAEVLARTITGLAFEGINATLTFTHYEEDEEE